MQNCILRTTAKRDRQVKLTHEAGWEVGVSADLCVHLDEPLLDYPLDLVSSQGILESVPKEHHQWNTFSQLVGARGGSGGLTKWSVCGGEIKGCKSVV